MLSMGLSQIPHEAIDFVYQLKHKAFLELLTEEVVPYVQGKKKEEGKPISPTCFISYAWGEAHHEHWVKEFAEVLEQAGLSIWLDRWEDRKGKDLVSFVEKIDKADFVIVVGTPLYLQKYEKRVANEDREHVVRGEGRLINHLISYSEKRSDRIIGVLREGIPETSFPSLLRPKLSANLTKPEHYFTELLKLIQDLHEIDNRDKTFESFFETLKKDCAAAMDETDDAEQKEFAENKKQNALKTDASSRNKIKRLKTRLLADSSKAANVSSFSVVKECITWNLPRQDNIFVGRKDLLKALKETLEGHKEDIEILTIQACAGLGGVGKTQLALEYSHHSEHYTLKAWFEAGNPGQLQAQYQDFAKKHGYMSESKEEKEVIQYIKGWLARNPGWLLVYDNVLNYEAIQEYLPDKGGSVIITTRCQKWAGKMQVLLIDVMEPLEAAELLTTLTGLKGKEVEDLAETLGRLPLALAQAGAYIRNNKITVAEYLNLYQEFTQRMLADKTMPVGANHVPVAVTWNISLEIIEQEVQATGNPPLAKILLTVCAYLNNNYIPKELLLAWLKKEYPKVEAMKLVLNDLLAIFEKYSLINIKENDAILNFFMVSPIIQTEGVGSQFVY